MESESSREDAVRRGGRRAGRLAPAALGLLAACTRSPSASFPEFGFEARYELPCSLPDDCCGLDNCGPNEWPWLAGPHERFAALGTARLARESLAWFEGSPDSGAWRGNATARLELDYPSGPWRVTARRAPDSPLAWEQELELWFERFPPAASAVECAEEFHWEVELAERGSLTGCAATEAAAVEAMKAVLAAGGPAPLFEHPSFSLASVVRRSATVADWFQHVTDCYTVEAASLAELDELPRLLREKRAQYARE